MCNTKIEQNGRRSWRKFERSFVELDGFRIPSLLRNDYAEIGKRFDIVWFAFYERTVLLLCFCKPALLLERNSATELRGNIGALLE